MEEIEPNEKYASDIRGDLRCLIDDYELPKATALGVTARVNQQLARRDLTARETATVVRAVVSVQRLRLDAMALYQPPVDASDIPADREEALAALREDPDYLDYLREKAAREGGED